MKILLNFLGTWGIVWCLVMFWREATKAQRWSWVKTASLSLAVAVAATTILTIITVVF